MARILIAGCGYVGSALAERLQADGHRVFALSRQGTAPTQGVRGLRADVTQRDSLLELPEELDFIFYLVAASDHSEDGYRAAYVKGLRNVLAVAADKGIRLQRLFFTSSTSVYGQVEGEWVDEDSPTDPLGYSGRTMLEAEESALQSRYPATVVRFSGIYGPGRISFLREVAAGSAACYWGPPKYSNRIHRDDCVGVLRHLMQLESPQDCYLASDDEPTDRSEFIRWLAARLSAPDPQVLAPEHGSQRRLSGNKRCRNQRLKDSGYRLHYPTFREGYAELCQEFRK